MPAASNACRMVSRVSVCGTRRSSSKSSISHRLIEVAFASLETDQLSNVRAERHCAAVIVIVDFLSLQKVATWEKPEA